MQFCFRLQRYFEDIERFYTRCDAEKCICPDGRTYTNQKWSLQLCSCCGSYGLHKLGVLYLEMFDVILQNLNAKKIMSVWHKKYNFLAQLNKAQIENIHDNLKKIRDDIHKHLLRNEPEFIYKVLLTEAEQIALKRRDQSNLTKNLKL